MSEPDKNQEGATEQSAGGSVVAALYAMVERIFARYSEQWDTRKKIMHAEWELSVKSLWLAFIFSVIFVSVMIVTWIGINAILAYTLYSFATPIWVIALIFLVLHCVAILFLVRTIRALFAEMGFSRTIAIFRKEKDSENDANEASMPVHKEAE